MQETKQNKIRRNLCFVNIILTVAMSFFIWLMMDVSSGALAGTLRISLVVIAVLTVTAQGIYIFKGQMFTESGRLAKGEVMFAIVAFQCIIQISFGFAVYAVSQTQMQNDCFDYTYDYFLEMEEKAQANEISQYMPLIHDFQESTDTPVSSVCLIDEKSVIVDSTIAAEIGKHKEESPFTQFRFPLHDGKLIMEKSKSYVNAKLKEFLLNMLTALVISILLMIELVYFITKYIDAHYFEASEPEEHRDAVKPPGQEAFRGARKTLESAENGGKPRLNPADYLRQISFLFYFTVFLSSSFIPIMARDLVKGIDGVNANFVAGLPYSVETLANCLAILLATRFFQKKGWKPPYTFGVLIFIAGTFASALSPDIYLFIISRAVVGIGYGFCWMTLRNVTMLKGSLGVNFSSLTAGIYAGMMCGVAFGAVLADKVGYRNILLLSAVLCAVVTIFPLTFANVVLADKKKKEKGSGKKLVPRDIALLAGFLLLIVTPTCITEAFCEYVVPLRLNDLHYSTADIGRVILVYNLFVVYIGATVLIRRVYRLKDVMYSNLLHVALIAAGLFGAAYIGGIQAMLIAAMILGAADGFGFSTQNAQIMESAMAEKVGQARMLTFISLFKKFGAALGPIVLSFAIIPGIGGLAILGCILLVMAAGYLFIDRSLGKGRQAA